MVKEKGGEGGRETSQDSRKRRVWLGFTSDLKKRKSGGKSEKLRVRPRCKWDKGMGLK